VTRERDIGDHFLAALVAGFALLLLLLAGAVYIAVGVMYPAEARAVKRAGAELAEAQIIESLHRDEDSLNAIFYKLVSGGSHADRALLRRKLDTVEGELERTLASVASPTETARWSNVRNAAAAFVVEGRKVLGSNDPPHQAFYERHEALNEAVAQVAAATFASQREADLREMGSSSLRIRYTVVLLTLAMLVAIAAAAFTVYLTQRTVRRTRWQAMELGRLSSRAMSDLDALARRFSRELHDQFGQTLTAMEANLVAMQNKGKYDVGRIEDCLGLIKDGISSVREVSQLLRPSILDDFGLDASLRWLAETFAERTGIRVKYESTFSDRMATDSETQVFRIAQEALTNAGRHSGASEVQIQLRREGSLVRLSVNDNGKGFEPRASEGGLGLVGMRARARTARGILMIVPGRGRGVKVLLEVPFVEESV